ncbi:hypothetical protein GGX14DRAFT_359623 [Mycena pura]|uniref:Uncharacterized protein n=1 Tax=Mycena pura TaxID=153505 RepID=A0AAD6VKA7_9AGAR|nr:hypothetical protein GGX14DRAFT_359623 [Mycena pura]
MAPTVALDNTLGALEVGTMISIFLFGLVTSQAFAYFRRDPAGCPLRLFLTLVIGPFQRMTVELVHTVLTCMYIYEKTITSFGDFEALLNVSTSFNVSMLPVAIIGPLVQAFYAYRILKLSGRRLTPIICWTLSILRFTNIVGISIATFAVSNIPEFKLRFGWLIMCSLPLSACTDILITVTTCYYLRSQSSAFPRLVPRRSAGRLTRMTCIF